MRVNTPHAGTPNRLSEPRVELCRHPPTDDAASHIAVYPGFSLADCDPISGDHTDKVVTWRGRPAVAPLLINQLTRAAPVAIGVVIARE